MKPIARVGDTHVCPIKGHGTNSIVSGGSALVDGRPIARIGDKCACGCVIVSGSSGSTCDGKPVAVIGAKTSGGGTIVAGSQTAKTA
ncbi:PAAR domain-containing protein [Celeribacter naphthalenivorans]|uniref:PAAR domain-containing protein n=1 Tax=Celeribacter naphthalenivorans TaxID=1614694 RepID=UPI001CFBF253